MRDPARIDRILAKLGDLWHSWPDGRLGQIVKCAATLGGARDDVDLWHVEEPVFEAGIDAMIAERKAGRIASPPPAWAEETRRLVTDVQNAGHLCATTGGDDGALHDCDEAAARLLAHLGIPTEGP